LIECLPVAGHVPVSRLSVSQRNTGMDGRCLDLLGQRCAAARYSALDIELAECAQAAPERGRLPHP